MKDEYREQEEVDDEKWFTIEERAYEQYQQNGLWGLFNLPFEYVEDKTGQDSPPPSLEAFLEQNHKILTIVGVFAGLVGYFSQLTQTPTYTIIVGMIGGALMFGVALIVVLHRALIALARSAKLRYKVHVGLYTCIIVSVLSITIAMMTFFTRFPTAVFAVVDGIVALVFLLISMLWATQTNLEFPAPIQFGDRTRSLFQNSIPIGSSLLFLTFTIKLLAPFDVQIPIISHFLLSVEEVGSSFLNILSIVFLIFVVSVSIAFISIFVRGIVVFIARLRNRIPF